MKSFFVVPLFFFISLYSNLLSISVYAEEIELATASDYLTELSSIDIITGLTVLVFAVSVIAGISLVGNAFMK